MLALQVSDQSAGVQYHQGGQHLESAYRSLAASMLAEDAVLIRCGNTKLTRIWRAKRDNGPPHPPLELKTLETYLKIGFGLPSAPTTEDHLQGLVAELIWGRVMAERENTPDGRKLRHLHPPKPDPLEPGGDGLAVYSLADDTLVFRLWEIKKYTGKGTADKAIYRASGQLGKRGAEYLAKLAGPETMTQPGPLGDLYADMVELWHDRSPLAGTGVAVSTSDLQVPTTSTPFGSLPKAFPEFANWGQLEGLLVVVPDFAEFAEDVRRKVWSGL